MSTKKKLQSTTILLQVGSVFKAPEKTLGGAMFLKLIKDKKELSIKFRVAKFMLLFQILK